MRSLHWASRPGTCTELPVYSCTGASMWCVILYAMIYSLCWCAGWRAVACVHRRHVPGLDACMQCPHHQAEWFIRCAGMQEGALVHVTSDHEGPLV